MKTSPHSLHLWSSFPAGVFLWVTITCLLCFHWAGDCLSLSNLGFLCCCSKVPSTSEVASNVEVLEVSFSENTCDSTSVMSGCNSDPLSLDSGLSSLSGKGWVFWGTYLSWDSLLGASSAHGSFCTGPWARPGTWRWSDTTRSVWNHNLQGDLETPSRVSTRWRKNSQSLVQGLRVEKIETETSTKHSTSPHRDLNVATLPTAVPLSSLKANALAPTTDHVSPSRL